MDNQINTLQDSYAETFWRRRWSRLSAGDTQAICNSYRTNILGDKGTKKDFNSFYRELQGVLSLNKQELEILVDEGFNVQGFIALLWEKTGCSNKSPAYPLIMGK